MKGLASFLLFMAMGNLHKFEVKNEEDFSNVCRVDEGDLVGSEMRILPAKKGAIILIQRYEGGALDSKKFTAAVERDRILVKSLGGEVIYIIFRDGGDILIKYVNGEVGRDGQSTEERLRRVSKKNQKIISCPEP